MVAKSVLFLYAFFEGRNENVKDNLILLNYMIVDMQVLNFYFASPIRIIYNSVILKATVVIIFLLPGTVNHYTMSCQTFFQKIVINRVAENFL